VEVNVPLQEAVLWIFESLKNNFVIKTVRVISEERVSEEVIELAQKFKNQRVAIEVGLNTQDRRFKRVEKRSFVILYP
jgi:hypothetical protein